MIPNKVQLALDHVRSFHPEVTMVTFNSDGWWHYTDDYFHAPEKFDERINTHILEDAIYDLEDFPCVFQLIAE